LSEVPQLTGESLVHSLLFVFVLFTFNFGLTNSEAQTGTFHVSVAGTLAGAIPHQIDLKVTQIPGGQLSEVTGFRVSPEDVVQVKQGENIIVSTSPDLRVHRVTVTNTQGIPVDLAALPSNVWSLQGLLPGIYTLNVNVAMSSSGILGTYETILVILQPDQQPLPPTTVIQFDNGDDDDNSGGNGNQTDGNGNQTNGNGNGNGNGNDTRPPKCLEGQTGIPPNCQPIDDPIPKPLPIECPDGSEPIADVCPDDPPAIVDPDEPIPDPGEPDVPPVDPGDDSGGAGGEDIAQDTGTDTAIEEDTDE
jgi:hypothetical protein